MDFERQEISQSNLQLTHLFLLGVWARQAEVFYRDFVGMPVLERTGQQVLFDASSCALGVRHETDRDIPAGAPSFTEFSTHDSLDTCITNLNHHGVRIYDHRGNKKNGRLAWFSDPHNHLHCVRQTEPAHEERFLSPTVACDPRLAYYFLAVDNLKVAVPFYGNVLGLAFIEAREDLYALFNAGKIVLGLRQGKDAGAGVDAESWTVFETTRCEDFYGELEQFGALPLGIRSEPHGTVYWFRAPGGHIQCFHDPHPDYALDNILKRSSVSA